MIQIQKGKSRSHLSEEEELRILTDSIDHLPEEERRVLEYMVQEMLSKKQDEPKIYDLITAADYEESPPPLRDFLFDKRYLGKLDIWPTLVDEIFRLFDGSYYEAIITGAIGVGKTFFASIAIARIINELLCLRSPQKTLGLSEGMTISFACLSVTERLALDVVFKTVGGLLEQSPYFSEKMTKLKKEIAFPKNIMIIGKTSSDTSVLGLNLFGGIVDEMNFMGSSRQEKAARRRWREIYTRAELVYYAISRRMKSRYLEFGHVPGLLFLVGSKNTGSDFLDNRVSEAMDDPQVFVNDYAIWEVNKERFTRSKRFKVLVGNDVVVSRILSPDEDVSKYDGTGDVFTIDVPEDFRPDFEHDMFGALRDIAGISVSGIHPLIVNRKKIFDCIAIGKGDRPHPFSTIIWDTDQKADFLWDILTERSEDEELVPIVNPEASRHIHIDLAKNKNSAGFTMSHISGEKEVKVRGEDGTIVEEKLPIIYVDVMLEIEPPRGITSEGLIGEINFAAIRRLVYKLSEHGFKIGSITMDSWQSVDSVQQFTNKGYQTGTLRIDDLTINQAAYGALKNALSDERIDLYTYQRAITELKELEIDPSTGRIDHKSGGSKDVADGLAATVYTFVTQKRLENLAAPEKGKSEITKPKETEKDRLASGSGVEGYWNKKEGGGDSGSGGVIIPI